MDLFIVGIRFQKTGKVYHFDASSCRDLQVGDFAVVETSRGRQLGEVIQLVENPPPPAEGTWKPIHHKATSRDLVLRQIWQKKEVEAMIYCRANLAEVGPTGVKIVAAEFTFDGARLSFLYSTEAEGKVDLRNLRNAMQRLYPRSYVEMRQIGPRDVAKILGGMGACGLEARCCSMFLTDFSPISIKMAKEQGISLTPSEITGMCGRLRCCLVYEYEQYMEARKDLPKRNKRVMTSQGEGRVTDVYPLKRSVVVEFEGGVQREYPHIDIQPLDELEALRKKAQEPCENQEGESCHNGKALAMTGGEETGEQSGSPSGSHPVEGEPNADFPDSVPPTGDDSWRNRPMSSKPTNQAYGKNTFKKHKRKK
jgi:cell fate regulator YaaT (PSP1 superfamily)